MEITSQSAVLRASLNLTDVSIQGKQAQDLHPMSEFLQDLELDDTAQSAQRRESLKNDLVGMSSEQRTELIGMLKQLADETKGTKIGQMLDSKLPGVEDESRKGSGVDRLLELLFMLMVLLGQVNTSRNHTAAEFGKISVQQAQASGANGISAANANLGGAISGMLLSTAMSGVGLFQHAKGTTEQIKNLSKNGRSLRQMHQENAELNNALNRQASPLNNVNGPGHVNKLNTNGKIASLTDQQRHLTAEEHAVLRQPGLSQEPHAGELGIAQYENQQKHGHQQFSGQVVTSFGQPLSSTAQAGAGTAAAADNAVAKRNDAEGGVATNVQHNEEQAAERSQQLLSRILSLVDTASNRNLSTIDSIVQAIRV
ncbi:MULTISPECIES: IpaC/SipC family type III secretion system effector [unclassified Herbaspirillum]|uniref:IpaC/SipC family type III secretion system effector n=1 Tax=unclassified Herbaspirillum TaxID=2624150 RepID=UPI0011529A43|nr:MULTISPECIES: IpaC/SipC family type III secretion system effector [unclassified Herbaspirillum]MBB5390581.1 hypothetical protein [Herbaspirillum sp. SJZ102]TQK08931.1 IpaC/SipC-like invasin protein C [Herbaspirillum sp. SJZ130]TQK14382.1 IpaC/SipC-like invasin protein C [Herbaspirillum sp. SJZ106]